MDRAEKFDINPHYTIAAAAHAQQQPERLVDLHHPSERGRKPKATGRGPAQLDDELQWMVANVHFIRG